MSTDMATTIRHGPVSVCVIGVAQPQVPLDSVACIKVASLLFVPESELALRLSSTPNLQMRPYPTTQPP